MARGFAGCSGCGRHVRGGESICPFCGATVTEPARAIADAPGPRLSRAAIFAGAAIVAGCSSSDPTPTPVADSGTGVVDSGTSMVQPAYGAPINNDGGGVAQPVYGAAAPDSGDGSGTGTLTDSGAQPVYGSPIAIDGGN